MRKTVTVEVKGKTGWITINNPPVNATSTAVRAGLLAAIEAVQGLDLAVLTCAGRTFIAGGDMSEFDATPMEPHLPDVVNAIETSKTPFLSILHGHVLGGGFEIAIACAFRIAKPGTKFGLPEVNVGLIPGAGGTQRAPRLLGWQKAVDMICLGKIFSAEELMDMGALDELSTTPKSRIKNYLGKPVDVVSNRLFNLPKQAILEDDKARIERAAKGQLSPLHNFKALQWAAEPFEIGQPKERVLHLELRQSPESKALRHIFFAERMATKPLALKEVTAADLKKITIVGGGLMGSGIAVACLNSGYSVVIIEQNDDAEQTAIENITNLMRDGLKRGKMSQLQYDQRMDCFSSSTSYSAAKDSDLAIEAVFENLSIKQSVFQSLAAAMSSDALLATNTSYLNPVEIFSGIENQKRCLGIHFFLPAHIMKLVEIVQAPDTSPEILATAFKFSSKLRKTPVLAGICDGFIGNRILISYRRAAEYLLADGVLPHEIDRAMRDFGMAMGPFEAQDISGLHIAETIRRRQDATRDPDERYVPISDKLCTLGRYGLRSGKGWYAYKNGSRSPTPDDEVEAIIINYAAEAGINRRYISTEEIQKHLLVAMANEGARIIEDGIAENDAVVDVVKVAGYGFPRRAGGPMYWAKTQGINTVRSVLADMNAASPKSWVFAERFKTILKT